MISIVFKVFSFFFFLFPSFLFSSDEISISLKQSVFDFNKTKIIDKVAYKKKFIYHYEIQNDGNKTLDNIVLTDKISDKLTILNILDLKKEWDCKKSKKKDITCKLKSKLKPLDIKTLDILVNSLQEADDEIINSAFVDANIKKYNISDSDVSSIRIIDDLSKIKKESLFSCIVDKEHIKIGDKVNFRCKSNLENQIFVKLDKNLKYIDTNDTQCKKIDNILSCKTDLKFLNIKAEAINHGYSICDFIQVSDKNITKSIPLQIDRDFTPNLKLSISSEDKVVNEEEYIYDIVIKNNDLYHNVSDLKLYIDTNSVNNFKFISAIGDGFECNQNNLNLNCNIDNIEKNTTTKLKIKVKAPIESSQVSISAYIKPNDNQIKPIFNDVKIIKFDYAKSNIRDFSKEIELDIDADVITLTDSFLESNKNQKQHIANSKIFKTVKENSYVNLKLDDDSEIIWAGLYWMGKIDKKIDSSMIKKAKNIYFKNKKDKQNNLIESNLDKFNWFNDGDFFIYEGMKDVSEYVKKFRDGTYSVSNLMCSEGFGSGGSWKLVLIIKNKKEKPLYRHISIYDGFEAIWKSDDFNSSKDFKKELNINVNGFLTPKNKKPDAKLFISLLGGDTGFMDRVSISDKDAIVHDNLDVLENSQSADIDISYIFMREQKNSDINISSSGDKFFINLIVFSTNIQN